MGERRSTLAQEIAETVAVFQRQITGHAPGAVTVVLSQDTLVVALHEALSPAERDLAKSPSGVAQLQEFHQQLFATSCQSLQDEIRRITGVEWREAVAELEPTTGDMVQAFTRTAKAQMFCLTRGESGQAGTSGQTG